MRERVCVYEVIKSVYIRERERLRVYKSVCEIVHQVSFCV